MKRKSFFLGLACFFVIISGIFFFSQESLKKVVLSADYPKYDNLENLVEKADTIIKGKITHTEVKELNITEEVPADDPYLNPSGKKDISTLPYTIFSVEIERTYKGDVKENTTIQVKALGGTIEDTEYILEDGDHTNLETGKKYVFFLETYPNSPASLLNPTQSSYEYDTNDNIVANEQGKPSLNDNFNFEMKDLEAILNN